MMFNAHLPVQRGTSGSTGNGLNGPDQQAYDFLLSHMGAVCDCDLSGLCIEFVYFVMEVGYELSIYKIPVKWVSIPIGIFHQLLEF